MGLGVGDRGLRSDLQLFRKFERRLILGRRPTEELCGREVKGRALTGQLEEMD
jgi:hypothetical protein